MSTVGFTATRRIWSADRLLIRTYLRGLPPDTRVVVGACRGGDGIIAREARTIGLEVHAVVPAKRTQVDPDWRRYCTSFEELPGPPDSDSYRRRNERIVRVSDRVVGFAHTTEDRDPRSGTWMTIRMARRAKKLDEVFVLHQPEEL